MTLLRPRPCPGDGSTWLLIAITIMVFFVARIIDRIPYLLDYPSERSHPQWKSSRNLCLRLSLTTAIRG
jgi:hypothetical protein